MASIRRRGRTYHITVSLGVDENYKQVRKFTTFEPPHGLTKKQGYKAALEYARGFESKCRGLTSYDENMTLQALCEWYYINIAPNRLRERTLENFRNRLGLYILPKYGQRKLRDLKPAMFAAHFAELQKSGGTRTTYRVRGDFSLKAIIAAHGSSYRELERQGISSKSTMSYIANGGSTTKATCQRICKFLDVDIESAFEVVSANKPLTAGTVKGTQANLSTVFTAAVRTEIITQNPLANLELPKVGEIDRPALTLEQAQLFLSRLSAVRHVSVKAILIVGLLTGARTGELRALTWGDVNLDNGLINICKGADNKNRVTLPKTKSSIRVIKADVVLVRFLFQYRQLQNEQINAVGPLWTDNDLVFPNTTGGHLNACLANRTLKEIIQGTDMPPTLHAHSLRHSFASILIDSGANVKTVQDALGHSSSRMTLDIYSHSFASARARAMEAVSLAITGGNDDLLSLEQYLIK